jgi:hypothetical protein
VQSVLHVSFFLQVAVFHWCLLNARRREVFHFFLWFVFYSYPIFSRSFDISINRLDSRYLLLRLSYEF